MIMCSWLKMKVVIGISCVILNIIGLNALIIPDELPSILSVIYSNIPTLKKGTDSRIGWGFRLGDRADFQVLVELGPQTNTQPLANQAEGSVNKRNSLNNLANTLYAQRQHELKENMQKEKDTSIHSQGGQWLQNWSKTITKVGQQDAQIVPPMAKQGIAIGEIDAKSVIPDDTVLPEMKKQRKNDVNQIVKAENKANHKKATTNRSLISILTAEKNDQTPLDDGSVNQSDV